MKFYANLWKHIGYEFSFLYQTLNLASLYKLRKNAISVVFLGSSLSDTLCLSSHSTDNPFILDLFLPGEIHIELRERQSHK